MCYEMNRDSFFRQSAPYVCQSIIKKYSHASLFSSISTPKKSPQSTRRNKVYDYFKQNKQKLKARKKTAISQIFQIKLPTLSNALNMGQKKDLQDNRAFGVRRVIDQLALIFSREQNKAKDAQIAVLYELVEFEDLKEVWQKIKTFKADKKFLLFRSTLSSFIFYSLAASVSREFGIFQASIESSRFCQLIALKNKWFELAMIYFWEEADNLMKMNRHNEAVQKLKYALELAALVKDQTSEMKILYKIGVNYYYIGNSRMGYYYYQLSYKGLEKKERQSYERQFDLNSILKHVESQIFKLPQKLYRVQKSLQKEEEELNKENIIKQNQKSSEHKRMISEMLRVKSTIKNAQLMRNHMNMTLSHAQIKQVSGKFKDNNLIQQAGRILTQPVQNCTQILKTHLSKERSKKNTRVQGNDWRQLCQFIRQAYYQRVLVQK